jgi:hypothetical protein
VRARHVHAIMRAMNFRGQKAQENAGIGFRKKQDRNL